MLNRRVSLLRRHTTLQTADLGVSANDKDDVEHYIETSSLQSESDEVEERDELRAELSDRMDRADAFTDKTRDLIV
jgi:hypothetical protein